jgi:hypothetical protein
VAYLSQRGDGASWSVLMIGTQTILTGFVFLLAIRHGEGVSTNALASIGGALAAGAVGEADVSLLLYPVY